MKQIKHWFSEEDKRNSIFVIIFGIALLISIFGWLETAFTLDTSCIE